MYFIWDPGGTRACPCAMCKCKLAHWKRRRWRESINGEKAMEQAESLASEQSSHYACGWKGREIMDLLRVEAHEWRLVSDQARRGQQQRKSVNDDWRDTELAEGSIWLLRQLMTETRLSRHQACKWILCATRTSQRETCLQWQRIAQRQRPRTNPSLFPFLHG